MTEITRQPRALLALFVASTLVTALCIVAIDVPLARWLAGRDVLAPAWNTGIAWLEYAIGIEPWKWLGVCVLCAGVAVTLAVPRWHAHARAWMFVALTHLLARNLMLPLKTLTGRLRPSEWLARGGDQFFRDGGIAFPSGHVIYVASLALPLAIVWPRARIPLAAAIGFVMIARLIVNAHFASDVIGGLALVAGVTWLTRRTL